MEKRCFFKLNDFVIYAGGVLFYRIKPITNELEFLMMKNRGRYEDLGGRVDCKDKTIFDTIAREVEEESNNLITRESVFDRIKTMPYLHTKVSKYIIFVIKASEYEENLTSEMFGTREFHDNIERTAHWVSLSEFYKFAKEKLINFRLINRVVFDKLAELKSSIKSTGVGEEIDLNDIMLENGQSLTAVNINTGTDKITIKNNNVYLF